MTRRVPSNSYQSLAILLHDFNKNEESISIFEF